MLLSQKTQSGDVISYQYQDVVNTRGNLDYVIDGEIFQNNPSQSVMVSSSDDLSVLDGYGIGTIAYTAGFGSMWQKSLDGTWVEV